MGSFNYLNENQSMVCDAFRYFAALAVALHHSFAYFYGPLYRNISQKAFYTNLGSIGVAIFFFLSGFLISYTIQRKKISNNYDFNVYAVERFVRIYLVFFPAFAFALFISFFNIAFIKDNVPGLDFLTIKNSVATLFMLSGVRPITGHQEIFSFFGPAWTINYEFFAYFIFGALLLSLYKNNSLIDKILRLVVILTIGFLVIRLPDAKGLFLNWSLGVVIALLFQKFKSNRYLGVAIFLLGAFSCYFATVAVGFAAGYNPIRLFFVVGLSFIFLGCLVVMGRSNFKPIKINKYITLAAGFSYSLYLTHVPIIWLYRYICLRLNFYEFDSNDLNKFLSFMGAIAAVNLFAFIFAKLTEEHTNFVRGWLLTKLGLHKPYARAELLKAVK